MKILEHFDIPDRCGQFGAVRKYDIHTGIDLYCEEGSIVSALEDGIVVAVEDFTGTKANSPWWNDTKAVLVEGKSGVICYGEIEPCVNVGDLIWAGDTIGKVLKKNKGRPTTMLHLELYEKGRLGE